MEAEIVFKATYLEQEFNFRACCLQIISPYIFGFCNGCAPDHGLCGCLQLNGWFFRSAILVGHQDAGDWSDTEIRPFSLAASLSSWVSASS